MNLFSNLSLNSFLNLSFELVLQLALGPHAPKGRLFLETIADAVQRFDHIEVVVACLEFLA